MSGADYLLKRTAFALVTVFIAVSINFALFRLAPGSAVSNLSRVPHATQETRQALKKQFGLDKSRGEQYVLYLQQLVHGNFGVSFANSQPVASNLRTAIANTLPMVLLGTLFAIVVGTFTGVIAAWRRGTGAEGATVTSALAFYSMPTHWLGLMLVILFTGILPTGGMANDFLIDPSWWTHLQDVLKHMILPSLTLGLVLFGEYTLIVRSAMLETLGRGLHPHRPRERAEALDDRAQARPAERVAADRDTDCPLARLHRRGSDPRRDRLLVARHWSGGVRRGPGARLSDAAGSLSRADRLRGVLQPGRRPPVLQARSEDHAVSIVINEPGLIAEPEPIRSRGGILWDTIRRRPSATIGATVLSLIIACAVLAPWIAPYGLHEQVGPPFGPPSWQHPLGLDDGGIDMVTLLMWGARISLVVGFAATLVSMLIGGTVGVPRGTSEARSTAS